MTSYLCGHCGTLIVAGELARREKTGGHFVHADCDQGTAESVSNRDSRPCAEVVRRQALARTPYRSLECPFDTQAEEAWRL